MPAAPDFAERFFQMANDNEPSTGLNFRPQGELVVMARQPATTDNDMEEQGVNVRPLTKWGVGQP